MLVLQDLQKNLDKMGKTKRGGGGYKWWTLKREQAQAR